MATPSTTATSSREADDRRYTQIFQNDDFLRALGNSIGICLISTFVALVLGTMAAYAIARLDFPGKTASWPCPC